MMARWLTNPDQRVLAFLAGEFVVLRVTPCVPPSALPMMPANAWDTVVSIRAVAAMITCKDGAVRDL